MIHIAAMFGVALWYYFSAKKYNKSQTGWFLYAICMYLVLGLALLKISELFFIKAIFDIKEIFFTSIPKLVLSFSSMILIIFISYLVREYFIKEKKAL